MTVPFVNHHVHSHFSALDGLSKPDDIINRVVEMGQESVSITDHGSLAGIPQMYRAAKKAGIGFTPGIEAYFTKDRKYHHEDRLGKPYYHMILLAHNEQGYNNLVAMQTTSWEDGKYRKPRIDYEVLEQYHEGLTVTTACLGSLFNQYLLRGFDSSAEEELNNLIDIFGKDNVFVEIQNHGISEQLDILPRQVEIAKRNNIPLLATADSHYTHQHDHDAHDTLLCCAVNKPKSLPGDQRFKFESDQFHLHSGEEMIKLFPEDQFPGAVSNTVELAERTDFTMKIDDDKEYIMPTVPTEGGMTEMETLRKHVYEGAQDPSRYGDEEGNIPQEVKDRIDYELSVVEDMGFPGYFLIIEDFIKTFNEQGIHVGAGRGCLHPETEVLTQDGWITIDSVEKGDYVVTADGKTARVIDTPIHETYDGERLIRLVNNFGNTISLTEKHKVLSSDRDGNKRWVPAKTIRQGDTILSVTGTNDKTFENFKGFGSSSTSQVPADCAKSIIKDSAWGFMVGMMHSCATISKGRISWVFDSVQTDIAETLFGTYLRVLEDHPCRVLKDPQGNITAFSFESTTIAEFVSKAISHDDTFIGVGSRGYSQGFLQAYQMVNSLYPETTRIPYHTYHEARCIRAAALSVGYECHIDEEQDRVIIPSLKSHGVQTVGTVVNVDYKDAPDLVYDLTVEGNPSFLTRFGTVHNSAPGSVVVYCLGITKLDPFRHDLYFERFLNPDRISMPDIDIDVPKSKRSQALSILEEKYGHGHVAHLSNYMMMGMREALERVSKTYELTPYQAEQFKEAVVNYVEKSGTSLKEMVAGGVIPPELSDNLPPTNYAWEIVRDASIVDGTLSTYGIHACGIVITTDKVDKYFPLRTSPKAQLPVCQFDGYDVESLGGVKMDILGLINLDEAEDTERNILLDLGEEVDSSTIPLDDPEVYQLLSRGSGGGIFQLGCLSGDTIVDGRRLDHWYQLRNSSQRASGLRSVYLGQGEVRYNDALEVVYSGKKTTFLIKTTHTELSATKDHHIFTQQGWKKVSDLKPGVDKLLHVDDRVGFGQYPLPTIRGLQDCIDMFLEMHGEGEDSGWVVADPSFSMPAGQAVYYPTFHKYGSRNETVYLYPDDYKEYADMIAESVNSEGSEYSVKIYSYSEIVEEYYGKNLGADLITPIGTQWVDIESVEEKGEEKTYDIMMKDPINNFIANGLMVHNSSGIQSLLRNMKPDNFEDISSILALYRPGPMGLGTHDDYAALKNGGVARNEIVHEDLKDLLSDTYGLVVYQENIMKMSQHYAGYTGAEADTLRKATAKKIPAMMEEQKRKFIPAVDEKFYKGLGKQLWDVIEPFGEYAFNRSHSAAYAMLSYRTAWLKTHYPAQFAGAVIDYNLGDKNKLMDTISWIRQEGVKIDYPNVNVSQLRSVTGDGYVILPLHIIAGLGDNKAREIIEEREKSGDYTSVIDLVARNKISKRVLINMTKAGALDCLNISRAQVIDNIDSIMSASQVKRSRNLAMMDSLFSDIVEDNDDEILDLSKEMDKIVYEDKVLTVDDELYGKWERESLNIIIGPHMFSTVRGLKSSQAMLRKYPPVDTVTDKDSKEGKDRKFSGIVTNITPLISRKGKEYSTFDLETENKVVPGVIFDTVSTDWNDRMVIVDCRVENDSREDDNFIPKLIVFEMKVINTNKMKERG